MMDTTISAESIMAFKAASTQQALSAAMAKQAAQQEQALVAMLDQATKAAPGPGQGGLVDISV